MHRTAPGRKAISRDRKFYPPFCKHRETSSLNAPVYIAFVCRPKFAGERMLTVRCSNNRVAEFELPFDVGFGTEFKRNLVDEEMKGEVLLSMLWQNYSKA